VSRGNSWRSEKKRRPREEVTPYVEQLAAELAVSNPGLEFYLGGSWRRGAPVIGDIDVLIVNEAGNLAPDLVSPGVELPEWVVWQRRGNRIANGSIICPDGDLHLDVWAVPPSATAAALMFVTGPGQLNQRQRARAKALGLALSQNGLFDRESGEQLDDGTSEERVYELIKWPWLSPVERQRYA
jgi:DNA polymerase/3'-5' exonuclease PolX